MNQALLGIRPTKSYEISVEPHYRLIAAQLNLGLPQSPRYCALTLPFFSLGFSYIVWLWRTIRDVDQHLRFSFQPFPAWIFTGFMVIPGLHMICARKLIIALNDINDEDDLDITLSTDLYLLWLIPLTWPIFVFRIQKYLNQHWKLHVATHYGVQDIVF